MVMKGMNYFLKLIIEFIEIGFKRGLIGGANAFCPTQSQLGG